MGSLLFWACKVWLSFGQSGLQSDLPFYEVGQSSASSLHTRQHSGLNNK